MNINKAIIVGRLTSSPVLKITGGGTPIAYFTVATNRVYTQNGQRQESAEFHEIVVFGKQAETVSQHLVSGQEIAIEGRLQTSKWQSKSGEHHKKTEIIAENIQFGSKPGGARSRGEGGTGPAITVQNSKVEEPKESDYPKEDEINVDDIPF